MRGRPCTRSGKRNWYARAFCKRPADREAQGQALAYVYCEDEPGRRSAAKLVTRDEARRGVADCGEHRQAARAGAEDLIRIKSPLVQYCFWG
jgi:hypothetical protein